MTKSQDFKVGVRTDGAVKASKDFKGVADAQKQITGEVKGSGVVASKESAAGYHERRNARTNAQRKVTYDATRTIQLARRRTVGSDPARG